LGTRAAPVERHETREYVALRLRSNLDRAKEWPVDADIDQFEKDQQCEEPGHQRLGTAKFSVSKKK
jgi:hypothetical protein